MLRNIILASVLACLSLFILLYKNKKSPPDITINKIFEINETLAYKWEVLYDNNHIICEKKNNRWFLTHPVENLADQMTAIANVKNFNTTEYLSEFFGPSETHGITKDSPRYTIWERRYDGTKKAYTLQAGNTFKAPGGYFVRHVQSKKVFQVEAWVILALQKPLAQIFNRDFILAEPENIQEIKSDLFFFKKLKTGWRDSADPNARLDFLKIDKLVQTVGFLEGINYVSRQNQINFLGKKKGIRLSFKSVILGSLKEETITLYKRSKKTFASAQNIDGPLGKIVYYEISTNSYSILVQTRNAYLK